MPEEKSTHTYSSVGDGHNPSLEASRKEHLPSNSVCSRLNANGIGWRPFALSKTALISFAALFLALLIALILLWHFANRDDGLRLLSTNHYTWTYGPTAVLVVITSLWRTIDYHCKALMPWHELHNGPGGAQQTILLDYISPFQVAAFWRALKNRHIPILITITGFLCLKLMTIASTGLLSPTINTHVRDGIMLLKTAQLDASTYNESESVYITPYDPSLLYTAYAILERHFPYSEGTDQGIVYETLQLKDEEPLHKNTSFTANVSAFVPEFNCKPIPKMTTEKSVVLNDTFYGDTIKFEVGFNTSACYNGSISFSIPISAGLCVARRLQPITEENVNCFGGDGYLLPYPPAPPYFIGLADIGFSEALNPYFNDTNNTGMWNAEISRLAAVLCPASYTIQEAKIEYSMSAVEPNITIMSVSERESSPLSGFENLDLYEEVGSALKAGSEIFESSLENDTCSEEGPGLFLEMMRHQSKNSYANLFDTETMAKVADRVFKEIAVQIGHKFLLQTSNDTMIKGLLTYREERLQIQALSFALMVAGFFIMVVLTISLLVLRPMPSTIDNPESISTLAASLTVSADYQLLLTKLANNSECYAVGSLSSSRYFSRTLSDDGMRTSMIKMENRSILEEHVTHTQRRTWWTPFILSSPIILVSGIAPLVVIAGLEVLQRLSDHLGGFIGLQDDSDLAVAVLTRFLPALVVLLVATLFNCFDFYTALLAPFNMLKARDTGYGALKRPLFGQLPVFLLLDLVRKRYLAAFLASAAASIGSVLTIVVSGLYTMESLPSTSALSLSTTDSWDTNWTNSAYQDNGTAAVASLIESANLSYPAFTFDELAFPSLSISEVGGHLSNTHLEGSVSVRIPALRANLSCVNLPASNFTFVNDITSQNGSIKANFSIPSVCRKALQPEDRLVYNVSMPFDSSLGSDRAYFGRAWNLFVGPDRYVHNVSTKPSQILQRLDNPPGCPSAAFAYGFADLVDTSRSSIKVLICEHQLSTIQTDVALRIPDLTISATRSPMPDESTMTLLHSGPNNETSFGWQLFSRMNQGFALFNYSDPSHSNVSSIEGQSITIFDPFFQGVVYGRTPLPIEALETDRHRAFAHMQKFYRRYMAQAISANMRAPLDFSALSNTTTKKIQRSTSSNKVVFQGQFTPDVGMPRLVQHRKPKLVLQIMLATMLVCGLLAWFSSHYHYVVPWNPCTIAGTAVLFAGSRMCALNESLSSRSQLAQQESPRSHEEDRNPSQREHEHGGETEYTSSSVEMVPLSPQSPNNRQLHSVSSKNEAESEMTLLRKEPGSRSIEEGKSDFYCKPDAKFRLGWWRDGVFMGTKQPREAEKFDGVEISGTRRRAAWRYGIDVL